MGKRRNRWIMGSAIGLAAIAVAIDHTRHRVPGATPAEAGGAGLVRANGATDTPCGMGVSPCGLDEAPCGLGENPCGLGGTPCDL